MNKELDKELLELFLNLIQINATSGQELPVAQFIADYVKKLGFQAETDGAATLSGGNTGNVIVRIKGGGDFLMASHMDTPRPTTGVKPQLKEDRITSDETTILGVDDRGGIASILWALKRAVQNLDDIHPCTLLFTVCEETTLAGSLFFEPTPELTHGFVFDSHLSPGNFVNETCGCIDFDITVKGVSAHAGVAPEKGVNAIQIAARALNKFPFGRIDANTTANVGIINGGLATNVVPDTILLKGELRTDFIEDGEKMMADILKDFQEAAAALGGEIECTYNWDFRPYHIQPTDIPYAKLQQVFSSMGLPFHGEKSMGGSDANSLNAKGIQTINVGVGAKNPHGFDEYILYKELQQASDMAYHLLTK